MMESIAELLVSKSVDVVLIGTALFLSFNARRRLTSGYISGVVISELGSSVSSGIRLSLVVAGIVVAAVVVGPTSDYIGVAAGSASGSFWHKAITFPALFLATFAVLKLFLFVRICGDKRHRGIIVAFVKRSRKAKSVDDEDDADHISDGVASAPADDSSIEGIIDANTDDPSGCVMALVPRGIVVPSAFGVTTGITGIVAASVLLGPISAYVPVTSGGESLRYKVIIFVVTFLATYAVLKFPESHMQQLGVACGRYEPFRYYVYRWMYRLAVGGAEGAAIAAVVITGMHAQPWFDLAGLLESSKVAQVAEQKLGIGPALFP